MKKTFPLHAPGLDDRRVLHAVKHDIYKYLKRERRKTPPKGFNRWEFDCRVGLDASAAEGRPVDDVVKAVEALAAAGAPSAYVEILARPAKWVRLPQPALATGSIAPDSATSAPVVAEPAASVPAANAVPAAPADAQPAPPKDT
jgi:hypothetical protein